MKRKPEDETGLDVETLEASFAAIAPRADELVARFYSELFCRHPAVEPLFADTDMRTQQGKLLAALKLVVENVRHPDKLLPVLREMGRRHQEYGAVQEHYGAVAETLLDVMGEVAGPAWTGRVEDAWCNALNLIAEVMLGEYRNQSEEDIESKEEVAMSTEIPAAGDSRSKQAAADISAADIADFSGQMEAIRKALAVIEFNMDGTIITANDNFLDAMGYTLAEVQGRHHSMFAEPEYKAGAEYRAFWEKLGRGEYETGEFKRLGKDGREVWIQASYNPIFDTDGKPFKVVKYATDVTEQKLATAEFSGQIAAINKALAVIEFNMDGTIINANDKFLDAMGYTLEEVQGQHHSMFAEPEYKTSAEYRVFWEKLGRGEYETGEFKRLGKGGREVWIQASYNPILDLNGRPFKVVKYASDITEQKLHSLQAGRVTRALDGVTTNVMIGDNDLNIVYMNAAVEKLFREAESDIRKDLPQFDASKLMGSCIDLFHKNPAHQRNVLGSLSATHTAELSIGGRTMRVIASPVFSDEGERLGTVVEWADRTQELAVEQEVQQVVDSALAGDLAQRISLDGKEGFFERLSGAVNELVGVAERVITDTLRVFSAMSGGNLTETIEGEYAGSFGQLKADANETISKLTEIVGRIQTASNSVKTGADEISQGNTDLSQRTEEQASSLEETASSMEEMTSTVKQNADNAGEANQLAKAAREQAEKGGAVVRQAVDAMNEINASSKKISDIIGVIDEIAFQTNLLALNASVEAARAGDQGRGFAVVASEVRNLAGRSATAAKEIKDLIEDSGRKVDEGSRLVNDSGETLDEIVNGVKKVTDIVGEIAAASQEQSAGIEQVNKAVMQLDELTQQNAALVEQAAAASESMGEQADGLNQLIQFFAVDHGHAAGAAAYEGRPPGGVERRSAERPWTPPPSQRVAAEAAAPPPRRAAANGRDQEWEEF